MKLAHKVRVIRPEYILLGVVAAMVWSNLSYGSYHSVVDYQLVVVPWLDDMSITVHVLSNEILMSLFFLIAAKEIRESFLPGGDLYGWHRALLPFVATIGGVVGPALLYLLMSAAFAPEASHGWLIPTATDIALALLVAKYFFGFRHPAIAFITTIAVADDGIGIALIPMVYSNGINWLQVGLTITTICLVTYAFRAIGIKKWQVYVVGIGIPSWIAFASIGIEPAMALVPLVALMPHALNDLGMWNPKELESHDALNEMEHAISPWLGTILVTFGFVNGGISFGSVGALTGVVLVSLLAGKIIGIALFTFIGLRCGLELPRGMDMRDVTVVAAAASIGFTVSIFITGIAFSGELAEMSKMGAALSLLTGALAAYGLNWLLRNNGTGHS